jgi:hypothetical protein
LLTRFWVVWSGDEEEEELGVTGVVDDVWLPCPGGGGGGGVGPPALVELGTGTGPIDPAI